VMAGVSCYLDGLLPVPFFYASPTQLNLQIPFDATPGRTHTLTVNNNGKTAAVILFVDAVAPAIFAVNSQGQGAILDTSYRLVDSSHPATAGSSYIQIYGTGLGAVSNPPATGWPALGLSNTMATPTVTIGGVPVTAAFSGLAPGLVGLYQVNALVPAASARGSAVPVSIAISGATSNTVIIAVQ
jgi:uncharacterized protein (TIGR03437 family)